MQSCRQPRIGSVLDRLMHDMRCIDRPAIVAHGSYSKAVNEERHSLTCSHLHALPIAFSRCGHLVQYKRFPIIGSVLRAREIRSPRFDTRELETAANH